MANKTKTQIEMENFFIYLQKNYLKRTVGMWVIDKYKEETGSEVNNATLAVAISQLVFLQYAFKQSRGQYFIKQFVHNKAAEEIRERLRLIAELSNKKKKSCAISGSSKGVKAILDPKHIMYHGSSPIPTPLPVTKFDWRELSTEELVLELKARGFEGRIIQTKTIDI